MVSRQQAKRNCRKTKWHLASARVSVTLFHRDAGAYFALWGEQRVQRWFEEAQHLSVKSILAVKLFPLAEWRGGNNVLHRPSLVLECVYSSRENNETVTETEHRGQNLWETELWKVSHPCSGLYLSPSLRMHFESTGNWIFSVFPLLLDHSKLTTYFLSSLICYSPVYQFSPLWSSQRTGSYY